MPRRRQRRPGAKPRPPSGSAFSIGRSSSSRAVSTDDPIASSVPPFSTNARSFFQPSSPTPNAHDHSAGSLRFGSSPLTMRAFDVLDGSRMTSYFALRSPVKSCAFTIS